jgi:hypothetical protein
MTAGAGSWAVYRAYNAAGELLYVGNTGQGLVRLEQHARKDWWPEVAAVTVDHFDDRDEARYAEQTAIAEERPMYNRIRPGWAPAQVEEARQHALGLATRDCEASA